MNRSYLELVIPMGVKKRKHVEGRVKRILHEGKEEARRGVNAGLCVLRWPWVTGTDRR